MMIKRIWYLFWYLDLVIIIIKATCTFLCYWRYFIMIDFCFFRKLQYSLKMKDQSKVLQQSKWSFLSSLVNRRIEKYESWTRGGRDNRAFRRRFFIFRHVIATPIAKYSSILGSFQHYFFIDKFVRYWTSYANYDRS